MLEYNVVRTMAVLGTVRPFFCASLIGAAVLATATAAHAYKQQTVGQSAPNNNIKVPAASNKGQLVGDHLYKWNYAEVGGWEIVRYTNDAKGREIDFCTATLVTGNRSAIKVQFSGADFSYGFRGFGSESIGSPAKVTVWYGDDRSNQQKLEARLEPDPDGRRWLLFHEGNDPGSLDAIMNTNTVHFAYEIIGQEYVETFLLKESDAALQKMFACRNNTSTAEPATVSANRKYPVESDAHRMGTGCPRLGSVISPTSNAPTTIEFVNRIASDRATTIYRIDSKGNPVGFAIFDKKPLMFTTYVGHSWIVKDSDGRCYGGVFVAKPGHNRFVVRGRSE